MIKVEAVTGDHKYQMNNWNIFIIYMVYHSGSPTQCNHLSDMSESIPWQYVIIRGLLFLIGPEYCKFGW